MKMRQNFKLVIQYDGSRFAGWQKQGNTEHTIQGIIEEILSRYFETKIEIHGSGRTDAGVHAFAQTANFSIETENSAEEIKEELRHQLPEDIVIQSIIPVSLDFHSRYHAVSKTYEYHIAYGDFGSVFQRRYEYRISFKPDMERMRTAAKFLIGRHDFKAFSSRIGSEKSTIRELYNIEIMENFGHAIFRYCGNGFLYNMIRILTGTLLEFGEGKRCPDEIIKILNDKNRSMAGFTAPANGLFLTDVEYNLAYKNIEISSFKQ